ncbi:type-1 restriction enzyme EcoKI specificity protein [Comamonadaceae bacterium OS-4]|nr:type-1 restriction enzyme EcoKI specificity protein [Comamonadaceae bacterium OS-4]
MLLSNLHLLTQAPNGVAWLRELILTLAVQGKLVPQDPNDEPASELLKKIRTEKDRLIAEGKIKRDKPLAEIAEEEKPFGLPNGWSWVKGRDLFSVIRGVTYQKTDARDTPTETHLPILRANNIRGTVNLDDLVYVPAALISEDQLLRAGDYVVCLASGSKNLVGKAAPFTESLGCSFGAFCGAIRPIQEIAYFAVYLASPMYRDSVSEASAGIGINNLKGSSLLDLDIALPPAPEQSRIVTRVKELMRLCDALQAKSQLEATQHVQLVSTLLATLTESETPAQLADSWNRIATHFDLLLDRPESVDALEQTILQLAVRGLLVPQDPQDEPASELLKKIRVEKDKLIAEGKIKRDKPLPPIAEDEQPFALPTGWNWVRMQEAFDVRDGTHDTPKYVEQDGVPLITSRNFDAGKICFDSAKLISRTDHELIMRRSRVDRGDILYSMIGGNIGNQVLVDTDREFSIKNVALFKYVSRTHTLPLYLNLFLETVTLGLQGRAVGGAQPFVSLSLLRSIPFPLPPAAEQSRIVTRVAQLRRLCADLRLRLAASQSTQAHLAEALVQEVA